MLTNFGGSARSRPRVNLGGKRKELSKDELLRKAAVERAQREEVRRREAAATVIQRQWTAWGARRRVMNGLRRQFDERWPPDSDDAWRLLMRQYHYFFNPKTDRLRTVGIVDLLLEVDVSYIDNSASTTLLSRFIQSISLTCLANQITEKIASRMFKVVWLIFEKDPEVNLPFMDRSFYNMLAKHLSLTAERSGLDYWTNLLRLIFKPLEWRSRTVEMNYQYFVDHILTVPVLRNTTDLGQRCEGIHIDILARSLCVVLDDPQAKKQFGSLDCLLGQFVEMTKQKVASSPVDTRTAWMSAISKLCIHLVEIFDHDKADPTNSQIAMKNDLQSMEQTDDMPFSHAMMNDQYTAGQVRELYKADLVRSLVGMTFQSSLATYTNVLLQCFPSCRDVLLMNLSLVATSTSSAYNLLEAAYIAWTTSKTIQTSRPSDMMLFYLEILSRVLITMGDEEFFNPLKNPLRMDIIQDTATKLKEGVYTAYMEYKPSFILSLGSGYHCNASYFQDLASRVLQQIQIRDSRRPYLPKGFWLYTEKFEMGSLMQQVATEAYPSVDEDGDEDDVVRVRKGILAPRIRLLANCPFFFPFHLRIEILQTLINMDAQKSGYRDYFSQITRHRVVCRREHEFEDGFEALWKVGSGIKGPLSVDYRDVYGLAEAGIDGGGLTKEFLTSVCRQAFQPDFGMFVETSERLLYPNPAAFAKSATYLQQYEFLGRVIAKCMYDGILVDVAFAPFFLLKWVGKMAYIDDLQALDKDLYNGLIQLKNYSGDVEADLALDFTINEEELGQQRTINLLPNGSEVAVTRANRLQYIQLVCNFKLNSRLSRQSQAFVKGMSDVLDLRWLGMFDVNEMQALVGGAPVPIDIADLRRNTVYGGYDEGDTTVQIFWDVLAEFSNEERRKLVKFVTSTPRPPLLGFKELQPNFSLRNAGGDVNRLPTASTCVNLLKLPAYQSHEQMRHKLRLSITAEAGFDLS